MDFYLWLAAIVALVVDGILFWADKITLAHGLAVLCLGLAAAFAASAYAVRRP